MTALPTPKPEIVVRQTTIPKAMRVSPAKPLKQKRLLVLTPKR